MALYWPVFQDIITTGPPYLHDRRRMMIMFNDDQTSDEDTPQRLAYCGDAFLTSRAARFLLPWTRKHRGANRKYLEELLALFDNSSTRLAWMLEWGLDEVYGVNLPSVNSIGSCESPDLKLFSDQLGAYCGVGCSQDRPALEVETDRIVQGFYSSFEEKAKQQLGLWMQDPSTTSITTIKADITFDYPLGPCLVLKPRDTAPYEGSTARYYLTPDFDKLSDPDQPTRFREPVHHPQTQPEIYTPLFS